MHHCSCYLTKPKNKEIKYKTNTLRRARTSNNLVLNTRVCASAFAAILYDCIIVQRLIPRPRRRQQPAMHLIFHQGRVRPWHRQSRGIWCRRCWLGCETRLTAVTCYGEPSTSDLRPCAIWRRLQAARWRVVPLVRGNGNVKHHLRLDPVRHLHQNMWRGQEGPAPAPGVLHEARSHPARWSDWWCSFGSTGSSSRRSRLSTTPLKPTKQRQLGAKRKLRKWRGQRRTQLLSWTYESVVLWCTV